MNKITLRQFYDTSGDYKAVRCKTFEEAKTFWQASKKINHLTDIENENQLKRIYSAKPNTEAIFCFSDEDWWADDKFYERRVIYDFEDIKIPKSRNGIKDKLYKVIEECDIDLLAEETDILVDSLIKHFQIKEKESRLC